MTTDLEGSQISEESRLIFIVKIYYVLRKFNTVLGFNGGKQCTEHIFILWLYSIANIVF